MEVAEGIKFHYWHLDIQRGFREPKQAVSDRWCEYVRVGLKPISIWLDAQLISYSIITDGFGINFTRMYGDVYFSFENKRDAMLFKLKWVDCELPIRKVE